MQRQPTGRAGNMVAPDGARLNGASDAINRFLRPIAEFVWASVRMRLEGLWPDDFFRQT